MDKADQCLGLSKLASLSYTPKHMSELEQMENDQLVEQWAYGRAENTKRGYRAEAARLFHFLPGKNISDIKLKDLQNFAESLKVLPAATVARRLYAIRSLFKFAWRLGVIERDLAQLLIIPMVKNTLAERIIPEEEALRMIEFEKDPRDIAILRLLYGGGLRVSEVAQLRWRDLAPRKVKGQQAGQVTVFGKGGRTRAILVSPTTWEAIQALKGSDNRRIPKEVGPDDPVFVSRNGGHLNVSSIYRMVTSAAFRAGLEEKVSPHWLRHAHASHALDNGAPIHLVQYTLGHSNVATTSKYLHVRPEDSSSRFLLV